MFYYVTITRNGDQFFVVSPHYGKYELSPTKAKNTYLWESEGNARSDKQWQHLVLPSDVIEIHRAYRS